MTNATDTLNIQLASSSLWENGHNMRMNDMVMTYDDDGNPVLLSDDVRFRLKKSKDSVARMKSEKKLTGLSLAEARAVAEKIDYSYTMEDNTLRLNDFLTTEGTSRFKDQEVRVNLFLPVGTILKYDSDSGRNWTMSANTIEKIWTISKITYGKWVMMPSLSVKIVLTRLITMMKTMKTTEIRINEDGIDINIKDDNGESFKMKVNEDGVKIKANDHGDSVDINIDEEGVKIDANDN